MPGGSLQAAGQECETNSVWQYYKLVEKHLEPYMGQGGQNLQVQNTRDDGTAEKEIHEPRVSPSH